MGDAKFTYMFELDAATAESTAKRLAAIYQKSLSEVKIPALQLDSSAGQAMVAQARAQQAQITSDARAQANERSAAARAEGAIRAQEARAAASQQIEVEKRLTAETKAEIRQRELAQQQANRGSSAGLISGGGISGLLGTTVAGVGLGYAAREGFQFLSEANGIATAYRRQQVAAVELAGSQSKLNELMRAYEQATGGAVNKANALAQVTKLETLGFADSSQEVSRFTRGARGASLATGSNTEYIVGQAQLAIANEKTARLDQIGIGVEEFQKKLESLKAANDGLTGSALYEEAVLQIWEEKFGAITNSAAGAATGVERLSAAWDNLKLKVGNSDWFNDAAGAAANVITYASGSDEDRLNIVAPKNIERARGRIQDMEGGPFGVSAAETQKQLANLDALQAAFRRQEDLFAQGVPGARTYAAALNDMTMEMAASGSLADEYIPQLDMINQRLAGLSDSTNQVTEDTRQFIEVQNGVITKAGALAAGYANLDAAAQGLASSQAQVNATFALAQQLLADNYGVYANIKGIQGPRLPTSDEAQQSKALQAGTFLSPGGTGLGDVRDDWQKRFYQENESATKAAIRERQSADEKAAREWGSAGEKAQKDFEQAAKLMVDTFESKLGRVSGLLSTSEVTDADMAAAKAGTYQPKADEWVRRLGAAANGSKDVSVDWADAASRLGMANPGGDQKAQQALAAAASQQWASGSLFADRRNLDLINWDAVTRDVNQQRLGEQGQRNIIDYANLDPRIVAAAGYSGILPGRLGGPMDMASMGGSAQNPQNWAMTQGGTGGNPIGDAMTNGLAAGSMAGLQKFGVDAITIISTAMTGDEAQAQWSTLGTTIAGMMTTSIESAIGQTDFVGVITSAVLKNINDEFTGTP